MMTTYGAALRISETAALRIEDIDSARMSCTCEGGIRLEKRALFGLASKHSRILPSRKPSLREGMAERAGFEPADTFRRRALSKRVP
jgi:hypothetical protein